MQATFEVKPFQCRVLQPDRAAQSKIDQHSWDDQNTNGWQESRDQTSGVEEQVSSIAPEGENTDDREAKSGEYNPSKIIQNQPRNINPAVSEGDHIKPHGACRCITTKFTGLRQDIRHDEKNDQNPDQNGHIAERFHIYGHEF